MSSSPAPRSPRRSTPCCPRASGTPRATTTSSAMSLSSKSCHLFIWRLSWPRRDNVRVVVAIETYTKHPKTLIKTTFIIRSIQGDTWLGSVTRECAIGRAPPFFFWCSNELAVPAITFFISTCGYLLSQTRDFSFFCPRIGAFPPTDLARAVGQVSCTLPDFAKTRDDMREYRLLKDTEPSP